MLCYKNADGAYLPMFRCDACGEEIDDSSSLVGVYDENNHRVLTFHRVACDPGKKGPYKGGWIDGAALVAALCRNYNVDPKGRFIQLGD